MISFKPLFSNALCPSFFTEKGIEMLVNDWQPLNAPSDMRITPLGITDDLQPSISLV